MKVLLLQPPVQDFYDTDIRLQPIGLGYLKAAIQKHLPKVQVILKDYHQGWGRKTIPLPQELSYLKDFYLKEDKSPFSSFHHYYHFGADFKKIGQEIAREKPDLVGISALFSPYYREVFECAKEIKKQKNIPILVGGSQASAMPEFILMNPNIDFVIRGEGEKAFVEFIKAWQKRKTFARVPNLGYKKRGVLFLNSVKPNFPIETLPFPDLSGLSQERYLFEGKPISMIVSSRGCPYQCAFCSIRKTFGNRYRRRSAENIFNEIKQRYQEGYRVFDFEDDHLTFDKKEMKALCQKILSGFPKNEIRLLAMNGLCYWSLDAELLALMRKVGFTHLNLSLVSSNSGILKTMQRPHAIKKYSSAVRKAAQLGFKIVSYQILGLPGDSIESMLKTLIYNTKLPVLLGASPFYLSPSAPIARLFGKFTEEDLLRSRLTAMAIESPAFKREDLYTLFITTRILNFLKGIAFKDRKIPLQKALVIAEQENPRSFTGVKIFRKLLKERKLYAWTSKGFEPLLKFKAELFFRLWRNLDKIQTQSSRWIIKTGR